MLDGCLHTFSREDLMSYISKIIISNRRDIVTQWPCFNKVVKSISPPETQKLMKLRVLASLNLS